MIPAGGLRWEVGPRRLVEGGAKGLKGGGIAAHNKELKVERVTIGDLIAFT